MKKIMFLCHGNICRSPMAEYIFKSISKDYNLKIESKAVSAEEIGNPIYPPAARVLNKNNIHFSNHRARQITKSDYDEFDYIIVMESYNIPRLMRIIGSDDQNKVSRLLDFTERPGDIEDPWYSGNFDVVFSQIKHGCECLLEHLKNNNEI